MLSLNELSTKLMESQIAQLEKNYLKLDNSPGTYMPVIVERLSTHSDFEAVYSVSHYGEQNGDLMADPDMTFGLKAGRFYPLSFQNDYGRLYQEVTSGPESIKLQHELAEFADTWFQEIANQQKLNIQLGG